MNYKDGQPRRGDRRGFQYLDAADGARVRRGEPESAAGEARRPPPRRRPPAGAAGAKPAAAAAAAAPPVDGGWPRMYDLPSGGSILVYQPQVASWENRQPWWRSAPCRTAARPATSRRSARSSSRRHEGRPHRAAGQLPEDADHRGQFPHAPEGAGARGRRNDRQGDSRRRAGDRARSRAGQRRQEPDRAEERRGHQGRSADDLLQQDAGGDRQPRRRADLEPDQGQRSEVRRQHELGSVPARADQHVLPAQRRQLAEGDRRRRARGRRPARCPTASRSCRPTTTGRTSRRTCPGKPLAASAVPQGVRQPPAGGADSADRRAELPAGHGHRRCCG